MEQKNKNTYEKSKDLTCGCHIVKQYRRQRDDMLDKGGKHIQTVIYECAKCIERVNNGK